MPRAAAQGPRGSRPRLLTARTLKGGQRIRKPFNDKRGCTQSERDCPSQGAHVCHVVLPTGGVYGQRHSRLQHR